MINLIDNFKLISNRKRLDEELYIELAFMDKFMKKTNINFIDSKEEILSCLDKLRIGLRQEIEKEKNMKIKIWNLSFNEGALTFDEYNLYWKDMIVPGSFRNWHKQCSEIIWKNEMLNSNLIDDLFYYNYKDEFDWKKTLNFISNRNRYSKWEVSEKDSIERTYEIKNFLKILPTYDILFQREVNRIESKICIRCKKEIENWEHLWICENNEYTLKELIGRILLEYEQKIKKKQKDDKIEISNKINISFINILNEKSEILIGKEKIWELIRGVYNNKFNNLTKFNSKEVRLVVDELWEFCYDRMREEF